MEAGTPCLIFFEPSDEVTEQRIAVKVNHLLIAGEVGIATVPFGPVRLSLLPPGRRGG